MEQTIVNCDSGEVQSVPMSDDEVATLEQAQADMLAVQQSIDDAKQQEVAQAEQARSTQATAAQTLIDTAVNQAQADALRAFIRTMGVEV